MARRGLPLPNMSLSIPLVVFTIGRTLMTGSIAASGAAIDIGTASNASSWRITGAGAIEAPAMQVLDNISISDNGFSTGTFVEGGSPEDFNGFWYADVTFFLPATATNIQLMFSDLWADDRVVLQLNGTDIGNFFLLTTPGTGVIALPPGPPDVAFTFTHQTSGVVSSGFLIGQDNVVRMIVNNTGWSNLAAPTCGFKSTTDNTAAGLIGTVTYSLVETSTLTLEVINPDWGTVAIEPNDPNREAFEFPLGTEVTLTATPIEGRAFKSWEIFDPSFPGDSNYAVVDSNLSTTVVMMADREVTAVFKCGSSIGPLLPSVGFGIVAFGVVQERRRRR